MRLSVDSCANQYLMLSSVDSNVDNPHMLSSVDMLTNIAQHAIFIVHSYVTQYMLYSADSIAVLNNTSSIL